MADDLDELGRRLGRIEHALDHSPGVPARTPAGPEIRSARSIVNRIDDVWVAVTEGNERLVAAVDGLRAELARLTAALIVADPLEAPPAGAGEEGRSRRRAGGAEPAVHLRLNRIEEALAGIAGRLEELAVGATGPQVEPAERPGGTTGPGDELRSEIRGLAERVDALAQAVEAAAARSTDATLVDRLGRLREQFRR